MTRNQRTPPGNFAVVACLFAGVAILSDKPYEIGDYIILDSGELDRTGLRELVFNHPARRSQLESILHPHILHKVRDSIGQLDTDYCIIVIPLLVETGWKEHVDLMAYRPSSLQR